MLSCSEKIVSPDGVNLILDILIPFSIIQEFFDSLKVVHISWFKPLAVMQNKSFVLVEGKKFCVDVTFTDYAMRNALKS